jgi:hypothetical protein
MSGHVGILRKVLQLVLLDAVSITARETLQQNAINRSLMEEKRQKGSKGGEQAVVGN